MAVDQRLKFLANWRDDIEAQLQATVEAGASMVSDSDIQINRLAMASLRTELRQVNRQINQHMIQRAGKDRLLGFRLKVDMAGDSE